MGARSGWIAQSQVESAAVVLIAIYSISTAPFFKTSSKDKKRSAMPEINSQGHVDTHQLSPWLSFSSNSERSLLATEADPGCCVADP
jgi:hypothetical protein